MVGNELVWARVGPGGGEAASLLLFAAGTALSMYELLEEQQRTSSAPGPAEQLI